MQLRPFFTYFGGKYRLAPRYPAPRHGQIIEPFAGSAGYALRYPDRRVLLVERSEAIAGVWRYLTRVSSDEIMRLPLLSVGQSAADAGVECPEARLLIGLWLDPGSTHAKPGRRMSATQWSATGGGARKWGADARARIARQVDRIRHWVILHGTYSDAPDIEADWFIDPPYETMGRNYPHGARDIDYSGLAAWCRTRRGNVIVCENVGASWLPFRPFTEIHGKRGASREAVWVG